MNEQTTEMIMRMMTEIWRQDEKWGEQNHPSFPSEEFTPHWRRPAYYCIPTEEAAKSSTEAMFRAKQGTWGDILIEEVAEAIEAADDDHLIEELIQVAAVALQWAGSVERNR